MGAGKNKVRRKKRISKHVQDAEERRRKKQQDGEADDADATKGETKEKKSNSKHIKDPSEAAAYLSSWKHRGAGSGWKFNKNTQSWLIRHCYETDKVPKATFTVLIEYLLEVKGITRTRLREEAARRALRYKEYEKRSKAEENGEDDVAAKGEEVEGTSSKNHTKDDDAALDAARWASLGDHDKRKEYKRARKILDSIKGDQEESSN